MAVLVGIDEAGFGPLLGPLVVSSTSFFVPDERVEIDFWKLLRKSVAKSRRGLAGRLYLADSKKVFNRKKGGRELSRTVQSFLKCLSEPDINGRTLGELLTYLCPDIIERLENYPWYRNCGEYEIFSDDTDISIASDVLRDNLRERKLQVLELKSSCLDVGLYNRRMLSVKNKSRVLFTETSRLIQNAFDNFGERNLQIIVDRQGGRVHYRNILQSMFAPEQLKIVKESRTTSTYKLSKEEKSMRLHFVVGADQKYLPVSLASMLSKFLRELLVNHINRYFRGLYSELKPTAGYWQDGQRFIRDIREKIPKVRDMDFQQLVRCR